MNIQAKKIPIGGEFLNPFSGRHCIRVTYRDEEFVVDKISGLPCIVVYDTVKHNVHHIMCDNHVDTYDAIPKTPVINNVSTLAVQRVY